MIGMLITMPIGAKSASGSKPAFCSAGVMASAPELVRISV